MISSRGLCWSGQITTIGRRRLEPVAARHFSSIVQNGPIRHRSPLTRSPVPYTGVSSKIQLSRANPLTRNSTGIRFASTTPLPPSPVPNAIASLPTNPAEVTTSATASIPSWETITDFSADSLHSVPETIGYLKSMGLDYGYGPTAMCEWVLEHVHIFAGTPWWASIVLTSLLIRAAFFYPMVGAAENGTRAAGVAGIVKPLTAKMTEASTKGDQVAMMEARQEISRVNKEAGVKYWKMLTAPVLQGVTGFGMFVILRAMANVPVPGLETGGFAWLSDLTIADPFFVLPLATSTVLYLTLKKGGETGVNNANPIMLKFMQKGFPIMSFAFTFFQPGALQLYFFSSGVLSYLQASVLRTPSARKFLKMSPLPQKTPYATASAATATAGAKSAPKPQKYKGNIKIKASPVLSQEQLRARFEAANPSPASGPAPKGSFDKFLPKSGLLAKGFEAVKDVLPVAEAKKYMDDRKKKDAMKNAKADAVEYEERRTSEIKKAEIERNRQRGRRKAERAQR